MFSEKYNLVALELLTRLRKHKEELDLDCVDFKKPFPYDQFIEVNKKVKNIVNEIETEFDYEMSEIQCSWAVVSLIRGKNDN